MAQLPDPAEAPETTLATASTVRHLDSLSPFEEGVIDVFVRLSDVLGIPRSVGEIYGLLYASAHPQTLQTIVDRLLISKGSASQGLRFLRSLGAIKPVYVPGDRRDHFVPETELRTLLSGFLKERIRPHLEEGTLRLKALKAASQMAEFEQTHAEDAKTLIGRLSKLEAWHRKGRAILPLAAKIFG